MLFGIVINLSAQKEYSSIKRDVDVTVSAYSLEDKSLEYLKIVKSKFENSRKMPLADFKKNHVGIAFVLSKEDDVPQIFPAKFSFNDGKVNISAVKTDKKDTDDYVEKYLNRMESIGSTAVFKKIMFSDPDLNGQFEENSNEIFVKEPGTLSFVRGTEDDMYIISIDEHFKANVNPRIIVYYFKLTFSGENIFGNNSQQQIEKRMETIAEKKKSEREDFPLYHDVRTDEIRDGLAEILTIEPYKSDKNLIKNFENLNESITRYNIKDYVEEFKFLLSSIISKESLEKHFQPFVQEEVFNVKHLSSHALADFYFGSEEYDKAIEYYKKSIFEFPYEESSWTGIVQDAERIIYDIAKCNYYSNKKNEAYGYLIGLIIDSQNKYELASKDLTAYLKLNKEDLKNFKKDLDKALKTIQKGKDFSYNFKFREASVFFYPMLAQSAKEWEEGVHNSEFYKNLK